MATPPLWRRGSIKSCPCMFILNSFQLSPSRLMWALESELQNRVGGDYLHVVHNHHHVKYLAYQFQICTCAMVAAETSKHLLKAAATFMSTALAVTHSLSQSSFSCACSFIAFSLASHSQSGLVFIGVTATTEPLLVSRPPC
jgi:hypothetical protein